MSVAYEDTTEIWIAVVIRSPGATAWMEEEHGHPSLGAPN